MTWNELIYKMDQMSNSDFIIVILALIGVWGLAEVIVKSISSMCE